MKRFIFLTTLFCLLSLQSAWSQVPETLSYQGLLTDTSGEALPDKAYSVTFKFYNAETGGKVIWSETQSVQVQKGVFDAQLGRLIPLAIPFDQPYWLAIAVESDEELSPRIRLSASAYSLHARSIADSAVTGEMIADAQVVRSINGLKDDLELRAGRNISISQEGNKVTISATTAPTQGDDLQAPAGDDGDWVVNGNAMHSAVSGNVGIGTTTPQSTLHVNGTTITKVLTITGGADLAEPFAMSDESTISESDVVVIDAENPGHLKRSGKAMTALKEGEGLVLVLVNLQ